MTAAGTPGTLYLIPTPIGDGADAPRVLAPQVVDVAARLRLFIAESARSARAFLKQLPLGVPIQAIRILEHNEHTVSQDASPLLDAVAAGEDAGLLSDAGCPGVADPGAEVVACAHRRGIRVVPLPGPSSLIQALMASGLNGQRFAFAGYVPVDRDQRAERLRALERKSREWDETILMIETPYRNDAMLEALVGALEPDTRLTVAIDLGQPGESVHTLDVAAWKSQPRTLPKAPAVFAILAAPRSRAAPQRPGPRPPRPTGQAPGRPPARRR